MSTPWILNPPYQSTVMMMFSKRTMRSRSIIISRIRPDLSSLQHSGP